MAPIAYTYEADHHCYSCTMKRFGTTDLDEDDVPVLDSEGNTIGAVWSWDEWFNIGSGDQTLNCGDCFDILDRYTDTETP